MVLSFKKVDNKSKITKQKMDIKEPVKSGP